MDFRSDNTTPMDPQIMAAINAVNTGYQSAYGADDYTKLVHSKVSQIFEHEVEIYFVATGTAANSLVLASMVGSGGVIYCQQQAHINTSESGAPSFFSSCVLHPVGGDHAKISITEIEQCIRDARDSRPHGNIPKGISISQATEYGTAYSLEELAAIKKFTQFHGLYLHMDGARFANALVTLDCSPAQMTWKHGVDVLSFGATKNGAMMAEMIVFFNKNLAKDFDYSIKRSGQLMSKARFIATQFLAYFENDLWLHNARHANAMANKLASCFEQANVKILHKAVCNEIFVELCWDEAQRLQSQGAKFFHWYDNVYRFVTSFVTTQEEIQTFNKLLLSLAKSDKF